MTQSILIHTTPSSYRVQVTLSGHLVGTNVSINEFCLPFIEQEYDRRNYRWVVTKKYRHYDKTTQTLYLPRYDLDRFINFISAAGLNWKIKEVPLVKGLSVNIPMKPWFSPQDDLQAAAISYLVNDPSPVRGLALQTGRGKTASLIAALSGIGRRSMILVPFMIEQWTKSILKFTELTEDDIFVVQGMPSLAKLLKRIDKSLHPKIILVSIPTLRSYLEGSDSYVNFPPFTELCERLNVGVVGKDEAHLLFHANLLLDMTLNPAVIIPMTATFETGSANIVEIFDAHYPRRIRFGEEEYESYVDIFGYGYRIDNHKLPKSMFKGMRGYSQVKFEHWLLTKGKNILEEIMATVVQPILNIHYINVAQPGERLLILCSMVEMCEYFIDYIKDVYPQKSVTIYVGETDDSVLTTHDIIVSTPKSAGTGRDIPGLLTAYVFVSARSSPLNKQMLGRLRKLPSGRTPIFTYSHCVDIPSHVDHAKEREFLFTPLAKSIQQHML